MRRTVERKKRNRKKLRDNEAANPPDWDYWTSGMVCNHGKNFVKGRRRQRPKCYQIWVPPLAHPEWGREKVIIRNWYT